MKESVTYQAILREGRQEGLREGLREGAVNALQSVLLKMGKKKFGTPEADTLERIKQSQDPDHLQIPCDRIIDVNSWEELLS